MAIASFKCDETEAVFEGRRMTLQKSFELRTAEAKREPTLKAIKRIVFAAESAPPKPKTMRRVAVPRKGASVVARSAKRGSNAGA